MYKYLMATIFLVLFVLFLEPAQKLLSNFLRLEEPAVHQIQNGEWLSQIAIEYYGDPTFAKELALVNRAPDRDLVFPGEQIIVPDFENIKKIRNARSLSIVNRLVAEQQALVERDASSAQTPVEQEVEATPPPQVVAVPKSDISEDIKIVDQVTSMEHMVEDASFDRSPFSNKVIIGTAIFGGFLLLVGVAYAIRRKREPEEVQIYGAAPEPESPDVERSVYLDDFGEKEAEDKEKDKQEAELA